MVNLLRKRNTSVFGLSVAASLKIHVLLNYNFWYTILKKLWLWTLSLNQIPGMNTMMKLLFFPWNSSEWPMWCWLPPSKETKRGVAGLRENLFDAREDFVWILLHWNQTQWALARDAVWCTMLCVEDSVNKVGT